MKNNSYIPILENLAQSEGGIFTTAQAGRMDVPRSALSHAEKTGRIVRITHGAYRFAGTPASQFDELVALWKLTAPSKFTQERAISWDGVVVGGHSAAFIHNIGDFFLEPYRLYTRQRFNSRTSAAEYSMRAISEEDVVWRHGLPITRVERTLVDLVKDHEDPSLCEDAFFDAYNRYAFTGEFNLARMDTLLETESARVRHTMANTRSEVKRKVAPVEV